VSADVDVTYRLTRDLDEGALAGELDALSEEERARCARFVFARDRRDSAAAHVLLRRSLSARDPRPAGEWTFVPGRNGKPVLAPAGHDGRGLSFNIAHTRGLVACAVACDVRVGIDVEPVDGGVDTLELARHHFAPAELAHLAGHPPEERAARFAELWTLKEAYVKATGAGVLDGLDECVFVLDGATTLGFAPADRPQAGAWTFALFGLEGYRLAVAVQAPPHRAGTLRVRQAGADHGAPVPAAVLLRASPGLACVLDP
jgi:4'-phosphopantetheinyl transferase